MELKPRRKRFNIYPYLLLAPALIIMLSVVIVPIFNAVNMSFMNYNLTRPNKMGYNNFGNYSNAEYDAMMEDLFITLDRDERIAKTVKLSQFLIDDAAALFLGYPDYNLVSTSRVTNFTQYAVDWYCIDQNVTVTPDRPIP